MRARVGLGAGRAVPLAVLLTVVVIVTAGLVGTSNFTGARWYPHIGGGTAKPIHAKLPQLPAPTLVKRRATLKRSPFAFGLLIVLLIPVIIGLVALFLGLRRQRRRRSKETFQVTPATVTETPVVEPEPEPEVLLSGIELALQALDEEREPADAVVRAWLGLQESAEESGVVRRASETPTEFASRVLSSVFADDQALRTLLALYLRTRFGNHAVTAADVSAVRQALEHLLASRRAAALVR